MKINSDLTGFETRYMLTAEQLEETFEHWLQMAQTPCKDNLVLAIDTEFVRIRHFFPRPGLIQLSFLKQVLLVDTLSIPHAALSQLFNRLMAGFKAFNVFIAFHAPHEDINLLMQLGIDTPFDQEMNLIDTQLAANTLGYGPQLGLFKLAELILGASVVNSESRSNWLQRPLSWHQMHYAAQDVILLQPIAQQFIQALQLKGWLDHHCVETHYLYGVLPHAQSQQPSGLQSKVYHKVPKPQRSRFVALTNWRETAVRTLDLPKSWHIHDLVLARFARLGDQCLPPAFEDCLNILKHSKEASSLPKAKESIQSFYKTMENKCLEEAFYNCWFDALDLTPFEQPIYFGVYLKPLYAQLDKIIEKHAKILNIPNQVLVPKQCLSALIQAYAMKVFAAKPLEQSHISYFFQDKRDTLLQSLLLCLDEHRQVLKQAYSQ